MRWCTPSTSAPTSSFGYDHFYAPSFTEIVNAMPVLHDEQPDITNFEGWTALASWAEITSRAQIGLLVSGMGYRNPDLLADMARTVDHISGGRLILGVGAGWYEKDYTTYGFEYGSWKSRFDNFDAGLIRIDDRLKQLNPAPLREIPILIGGSGAKRTIPAIARHGDIWHSFLPIDDFRTASAPLDKQAAEVGRSGDDVERSVFWVSPESADEFLAAGATRRCCLVSSGICDCQEASNPACRGTECDLGREDKSTFGLDAHDTFACAGVESIRCPLGTRKRQCKVAMFNSRACPVLEIRE